MVSREELFKKTLRLVFGSTYWQENLSQSRFHEITVLLCHNWKWKRRVVMASKGAKAKTYTDGHGRVCTSCGQYKAWGQYSRHPKGPNEKCAVCKDCDRKRLKKRRADSKVECSRCHRMLPRDCFPKGSRTRIRPQSVGIGQTFESKKAVCVDCLGGES